MSTTEVRLILTELGDNNNKFWHAKLEGTTVTCHWGRVGAPSGQSKVFDHPTAYDAEKFLNRKKNEKLRKGYTEQHTFAGSGTTTSSKVNVATVAKSQIEHSDDETARLIDFLVKRNIHAIEGTTDIRFEDGVATTPLGPVTEDGLKKAMVLLTGIGDNVAQRAFDRSFEESVNQYLRIVPHKIPARRPTARDLFGSISQMQDEHKLLDALLAVVQDATQKATSDGAGIVFQTSLSLLSDSEPAWDTIRKLYEASKNINHGSAYRLRLNKVWKVSISGMNDAFEFSLGNLRQLWHGTRDSHLLSILKAGFIIPGRSSNIAITGRMFGDGIYFSDQSTKSLQYAVGSAPGQYGGGSERSFMFLNDVALGNEYHPTRSFSGTPPKGYDSTWVRGGTAGVRNNEAIVYRTSQVKARYLCQFGG